jgi:mRNA interferase RelE/StbE
LAENPHRVGKPLRGGLAGFYSARRGEYRVIYSIFDEEVRVEVVSIARRSNVNRPR